MMHGHAVALFEQYEAAKMPFSIRELADALREELYETADYEESKLDMQKD
jgi:hypothetical protein